MINVVLPVRTYSVNVMLERFRGRNKLGIHQMWKEGRPHGMALAPLRLCVRPSIIWSAVIDYRFPFLKLSCRITRRRRCRNRKSAAGGMNRRTPRYPPHSTVSMDQCRKTRRAGRETRGEFRCFAIYSESWRGGSARKVLRLSRFSFLATVDTRRRLRQPSTYRRSMPHVVPLHFFATRPNPIRPLFAESP